MGMVIQFKAARCRRILGVLPMPDGGRMAFMGRNMADVLRQWREAKEKMP